MKHVPWLLVSTIFIAYTLLVLILGFDGFVAYSIHLIRVSISVAVLIIYVPALQTIFREVPPPGRDYLLAGILLTWLSGVSFSIWNEIGRVFGMDTNIFTSPIAGLFSLTLLVGGIFHLIAPTPNKRHHHCIAIVIGLLVATGVVLIAPYFRHFLYTGG